MKKIYLQFAFLLLLISVTLCTKAQLTGTKNIPGDYATLALALTDLNTQGVGAGGVTLNLVAGNPQTTPDGGFVIGNTGNILVGATNPTATNPVIIEGNGNTITAFTPQTAGILTDAIFKLIGADYITIQNFTMQENAANIINTPAASNNMTEFGVALLRVSVTDGAQNNTIINNTVSLNKTYTNTFGIYSNVRHSATSPLIVADITNVSGSNPGNKIYGNAISNVNYGVFINGSSVAAQMDNGNDIGGSSATNGNTFTNWGSSGSTLSSFVNMVPGNYCLVINHQINDNASYNTITSALQTSTNILGGILKNYPTAQPAGTITGTLNNNTITLSKNAATGDMYGINNLGITPGLITATIHMNNNTVRDFAYTGAGSSTIYGIANFSACGILNMNYNVVKGHNTNAATGWFNGIYNQGDVVTTINMNNNQIGNASAGAINFSASTTGLIRGIVNTRGVATTTVNMNDNIVEGITAVTCGQLAGIINTGGAFPGVAVNIINNRLGSATANFGSFSGATTGDVYGFVIDGGVATTIKTINNNDIRGIVHAVTAPCAHRYIWTNIAGASLNISNNTFTNLSVNISGSVFFIIDQLYLVAGATKQCINNSIVTAFSKTAPGGVVFFYYCTVLSVNGSTMTQTGNNFSNVTVTGTTIIRAWYNTDGLTELDGPTKIITGNTFSNITGGSGNIEIFNIDFSGTNSTVSSNTISNINSTGNITGVFFGSFNGQGIHAVSGNTISNLSSTGTGGTVIGISAESTNVPTMNINSNSISGLSTTGASSAVTGVLIVNGAIVHANSNIIHSISGSGVTSPMATGISVSAGTTVNVGYNKIHTINQTGINAATAPVVLGISLAGGLNVTAHNNFVADLNAVNTPFADAIRGISVSSTTPLSTYNLYHNSIHVNSASALATSGTSGVYHTTNATATTAALHMIDNIIVNTSASAGAGVTAAFRRSSIDLTNFASTSNYNLLYAGTPSATNLIFYDGTNSDQTLAAYQARVATREANSISSFPNFTSSTDLHLTPDNCSIDSKGTPIGGFTNDIDTDTRSITIPDMGADEFDAYNATVLAGAVSTAVCANKAVVNTGTIYTDASCNLIARVLPSGGDPVAGVINTCVTLDASQLYFNGEPYVQRHFDLEPVISNQTTTSATITMYFTDAEFVLYNTNNIPWPALPTAAGGGNGDPNIANLKVTQFHGTPTGGLPTTTPGNYTGTRVLLTPVSVVLTGSIWAVTVNVAGFSGFYVHTNTWNAPLPVIVNYLTGRKQGSNHLLNWKVTCVSSPRATMTLERSADSRNFTGINTITADAARCNQPFDYTDAQPLKGMNYYRLKIVDADGKVTYSTTVALLNAVKGFDMISIAPNPVVRDDFKLNVASAQAGKMEISIFDMQGRLANRQTLTLMAGYNSMPVKVANLAPGTYTIQSNMAGDQSKIIRFVKQ